MTLLAWCGTKCAASDGATPASTRKEWMVQHRVWHRYRRHAHPCLPQSLERRPERVPKQVPYRLDDDVIWVSFLPENFGGARSRKQPITDGPSADRG